MNHGTVQSPDEAGVENSLKEDYKLQIEPASVKMFLRTEYYTEDAYVAAMEAGQQQGFKPSDELRVGKEARSRLSPYP